MSLFMRAYFLIGRKSNASADIERFFNCKSVLPYQRKRLLLVYTIILSWINIILWFFYSDYCYLVEDKEEMFFVFNDNEMYYFIISYWLFFALHLKYVPYKNDPDQVGCKFSKGSYDARTCNEVEVYSTNLIVNYGVVNLFSCHNFTVVTINTILSFQFK
ncbi:hypothetical protein [Photobacterium iliopiscarium]|uniref:hypothetical protein n=1 Tax=Photobacterium iliopiscarium TaxID=56192 RepID=UPI0015E75523|nr:hypothetical protein [Photobacterium iliopiscarium]